MPVKKSLKEDSSRDDSSIADAKKWLSHPNEFGRPPDLCVVKKRARVALPGGDKVILTLCEYKYNETGISGRCVTGALAWSFISDGVEHIDDDSYIMAYCGWYFVFCGLENGVLQVEDVKTQINVDGHLDVMATEKYTFNDVQAYSFTGKNLKGEDVIGATDGSFIVSFSKKDPKHVLPAIYFLIGAALNEHRNNHMVNHGDGVYSLASLPGDFVINEDLARLWHPDVLSRESPRFRPVSLENIEHHLMNGDVQPAVVLMARENLALIAVYSDEFNSFVYLAFLGDDLHKFKKLQLHSLHRPLLCSWTYGAEESEIQKDIIHGPKSSRRWRSGWPIIVELLCNDNHKISKAWEKIGIDKCHAMIKSAEKFHTDNNIRLWRVGTPLGSLGQYYNLDDYNVQINFEKGCDL